MPTLSPHLRPLDRQAASASRPSRTERRFHAAQLHPFFYKLSLMGIDVLVLTELYLLILASGLTAAEPSSFTSGHLLLVWTLSMCPLALIGGYTRPANSQAKGFLGFLCEHLVASIVSILLGLAAGGLLLLGQQLGHSELYAILITMGAFPLCSVFYRQLLNSQVAVALSNSLLFVVGSDERTRQFYRDLQSKHWPQQVKFFDPRGGRPGTRLNPEERDSPVLHHDLLSAVREAGERVSSIVVATQPQRLNRRLKHDLVVLNRDRVPVLELDGFHSRYWMTVPAYAVDLSWALRDGFELNRNPLYRAMKRVGDVLISSTLLVLLSPVMALVALLIKLDSPGPVIFRQERAGKGGRPFTLYKFRSMTVGADRGDLYTRSKDSRVTRIGGFLRRVRLDELPQLINVFRGDMSIVGPRAEWIRCTEIYERTIPNYHLRHLIKPGITGWAQVNYPYGENERDAIEKLKYDLYYIRHYSLTLDIMTVIKTFYIIIAGKGQ